MIVIASASSWRSALTGWPAWALSLMDIVLINTPMALAVIVAARVGASRSAELSGRKRIETRGIDVLLGLSLAVMMRGLVELVVPTTGSLGGATLDAGAIETLVGVAVLVVGYVAVSPIVEELFFRGLIQRATTQLGGGAWLARIAAIAVTTALFVFLHVGPIGVTPTWAILVAGVTVGIGCGALVAATGRVTGAVVAHVGFNGSGVILLLV
ncbi:CPBP family intramembrane glutamic endopeptidase [uncultured Microbacterium sp.]|uniref:CPBP family intramembrane glutamic endopeptidase n=1 Tax=uncultured Microbacterium sp. TaxID=191216 RepID=UPI00258AAFA6|nr:CPBP family intramembrane glutamic endopeptidase [uncultured Microbacterium sp.]